MADSRSFPGGTRPAYTGPIYTLEHPKLGWIAGRFIKSAHFLNSPVVQFRSIPFAIVPRRFAPCIPLNSIPDNFDSRPYRYFTQYGAACPQVGATKASWYDAYGGPLEDDVGVEFDEFSCLTATVSVPEVILTAATSKQTVERLPVMVYVHGGGAQDGIGHVDGLHSTAPMAAYSSELSLPVITVNIGYRLNWLGALVCQDIVDEYVADPSVSPHGPFNLGMQDQRAAFAWIHKVIGGFGGDPNNITAFGESAGSIFLVYHICGSPERLFNRVILQSGVPFGQLPFEHKEMEYQTVLEHFGIQGSSAQERLQRLRQVPLDMLVGYPAQHILPFVDDIPELSLEEPLFPRGRPTIIEQMNLISSCSWLEDIVIGDDFFEGWVFRDLVRAASPKETFKTMTSIFPQQSARTLLEAYGLPVDPELAHQLDRNLFWSNLMYFIGDLFLSEPINRLADHLAREEGKIQKRQRKIYRYSYGLTNPFPGSDHSFVTGHHFVEILFLFLTLLDRYPNHRDQWLHKQAKETAKRWIMFANGQQPWPEYVADNPARQGDRLIAICDDLRGWHVRTTREDAAQSKSDPWGPRRYEAWAALEGAYASLREPGMDDKIWEQKVHRARMMLMATAIK